MEIYPAIDLLNGRCVRLTQGDFSRKNEYNPDPVGQALEFEAEGARWIHIVDLDAARTGEAKNRELAGKICEAVSAKVQVGGGVRTLDDARELADLGVERAVVGTMAVKEPRLLGEMSEIMKIAAGLDVRDNQIAIQGWGQDTSLELMEAVEGVLENGVEALVVTDISRDGMLDGPNLEMYRELGNFLKAKNSSVQLIASGGIGTISDIKELVGLGVLAGAVLGKAIYESKVELGQAILEAGK